MGQNKSVFFKLWVKTTSSAMHLPSVIATAARAMTPTHTVPGLDGRKKHQHRERETHTTDMPLSCILGDPLRSVPCKPSETYTHARFQAHALPINTPIACLREPGYAHHVNHRPDPEVAGHSAIGARTDCVVGVRQAKIRNLRAAHTRQSKGSLKLEPCNVGIRPVDGQHTL